MIAAELNAERALSLLTLLDKIRDDRAWHAQAACRDMAPTAPGDPDLFFPAGVRRDAAVDVVEAKRICATCPVIEPCREEGAETRFGVWGGTSVVERRRTRRAARVAV